MSESLEPVPSQESEAQPILSRVQREPGKSIASAFVVGFLLSVFPVGRIISIFVGLGLTLLRPFLLVLGGMKLWEGLERRRK